MTAAAAPTRAVYLVKNDTSASAEHAQIQAIRAEHQARGERISYAGALRLHQLAQAAQARGMERADLRRTDLTRATRHGSLPADPEGDRTARRLS